MCSWIPHHSKPFGFKQFVCPCNNESQQHYRNIPNLKHYSPKPQKPCNNEPLNHCNIVTLTH